MELPGRRPVAVLAFVLAAGAVALWGWNRTGAQRPAALPIPGEEISLEVEVLNGTTIPGLARATTARLRLRGIDVVDYDNAPHAGIDSTVILVRRGDSTAAAPVRDAMGFGKVEVSLDSTLFVDLTVIVGDDAVGRRGP